MGWLELEAWLAAMRRQTEPPQASPDSWAGSDQDPWWAQQRAAREAERSERWGN